jgi:hypothetical protein
MLLSLFRVSSFFESSFFCPKEDDEHADSDMKSEFARAFLDKKW